MSDVVCPRRALLAGAGLTMLLAACGSDPQPATPAPSQGGGDAADGTLVKAADVPVGGGVVTADNVLVMQLTAGSFTAFDAVCPHQDFRVTPPDAQGVITCGAHQSHFKATDGSKIDGPTPAGLKPVAVKVVDGAVQRVG